MDAHVQNLFRMTSEKPGWCPDPHLPPCAAYDLYPSLFHYLVRVFSILMHLMAWTLRYNLWELHFSLIFFLLTSRFTCLIGKCLSFASLMNSSWQRVIRQQYEFWYRLFTLFQFCWNYGSSLFQECLALCVAYDTGIQCSSGAFVLIIFSVTTCFTDLHTLGSVLQNDLVHGWGLDFALRRCVEVINYDSFLDKGWFCLYGMGDFLSIFWPRELLLYLSYMQPAHEKIGIIDSQWIVHQAVPSLGNQVCHVLLLFFSCMGHFLNF